MSRETQPAPPDYSATLIGAGNDDALCDIGWWINVVANANVTILIEGEPGSGKEVIARTIYARSQRKNQPFVVVNCGSLKEDTAQSELLGHTIGAFTGANSARPGRFLAAHGGTLFLDEIGELPLIVQPLLLRAIENRTITRLGEDIERAVNVRIIAATNCDLGQMVKEKSFRQDLFDRLNVCRIHVPSIDGMMGNVEKRKKFIKNLIRNFCDKNNSYLFPERKFTISEEVLEKLSENERRWPGNAREISNYVQKLLCVAVSENLDRDEIVITDDYMKTVDDKMPSISRITRPLSNTQAPTNFLIEKVDRMHDECIRAPTDIVGNLCKKNDINTTTALLEKLSGENFSQNPTTKDIFSRVLAAWLITFFKNKGVKKGVIESTPGRNADGLNFSQRRGLVLLNTLRKLQKKESIEPISLDKNSSEMLIVSTVCSYFNKINSELLFKIIEIKNRKNKKWQDLHNRNN